MINAVGSFRGVTNFCLYYLKQRIFLNKAVNGRFVDNLDRKTNAF